MDLEKKESENVSTDSTHDKRNFTEMVMKDERASIVSFDVTVCF